MLTTNHFGCAAKHYKKSAHPRLLFDGQQLDSLRKRTKKGDAKKILNAMVKELRPIVERARKTKDFAKLFRAEDEDSVSFSNTLIGRSFDIGLVGLLSENQLAMDTAIRTIETIPHLGRDPEGGGMRGVYPLFYLAYDLLHPHLAPEVASAISEWTLEFVIERGREDVERKLYVAAGMNVPFCGSRYSLYPALAIQGEPGIPDLNPFIDVCGRFMTAFCKTGIGPNGFPEEDIGYGTACIAYLIEMGEMMFRAGHMNIFKHPNLRAFGRALVHFVQPWGKAMSITGDIGNNWTYDHMPLVRIAHETQDPTLIWLLDTTVNPIYGERVKLSNGVHVLGRYSSLLYLEALKQKPVHPKQMKLATAFKAERRGIVSVRSSWDKEATFAFMDGSQRHSSVMGHWHSSAGHFSLTALGEYFSVDTGRYNCDLDQHSVMLVDGESPYSTEGEWGGVNRMGHLLDFTPGPLCDTAMTDSSYMNDCLWSFRTMGLVKGEGITPYLWTVDDVNKANDFREFWWTLQTDHRNRIKVRGEEATIIGGRHGNMLDIGFVYPRPEEYPKPHTLSITQDVVTTSSYKYIKGDLDHLMAERDPLTWSVLKRSRLIAKLSGYNGKMMSVMVPRRKGRKPTVIKRLETCPNSLAVKIVFPKVTDTLIFAYEHGFLEAEDIAGQGDFLVVRRRRKDNEVIDYAMRNGEELSVGGKRFKAKN